MRLEASSMTTGHGIYCDKAVFAIVQKGFAAAVVHSD